MNGLESFLSNQWTKIHLAVSSAFRRIRYYIKLDNMWKKVQKCVWLVFLVFIKNTIRTMERKKIKAALPRKIRARFSSNYYFICLSKTSAFLEVGPSIM